MNHAPVQTLISPAKSKVRVVDEGVLLVDLGPAMGRTTAYPHMVLKNSPALDAHIQKVRVAGKLGLVLDTEGLDKFIDAMDTVAAKTPKGKRTLDAFIDWAGKDLKKAMPKKKAAKAAPARQAQRVVIDLKGMTITVELDNGTKTSVSLVA